MEVVLAGRRCRAIAIDAPAPGKGHDRWIARDGLVGVSDGATPLNRGHNNPGRLAARTLDSLVMADGTSIRRKLAAALSIIGADPDLAQESATLAAVVDGPAGLRAVVLGDCEVHVIKAAVTRAVMDRRLARLDGRVLASLHRRLAKGATPSAARAGVQPELIANRARLNTAGGYWAVGKGERIADHAVVRVIPEDFEAIVIASDGFARSWSVYSMIDPAHLARLARLDPEQTLNVIASLRRLERRHGDSPEFAQFSVFDDATAVIVLPA